MSEPIDKVCITGVGMVTSLGCAVDHICAAARAGIIRTRESEYKPALPATGAAAGVMVHAIPEITQGFEHDARTLRIMQAALADLKQQVPSKPWSECETRFFLSVPDNARESQGAALAANEQLQAAMTAAAKEASESTYDHKATIDQLRKAALLCGFGTTPQVDSISRAGHCGVAHCIERASRKLLENEIQVAIVGAFDSLLDGGTLSWLENTRRLKSGAVPAGLAPGEAGVCIVFEKLSHAQQRGARPLAVISELHRADSEKMLFDGEPPTGATFAELLRQCSEKAEWQKGGPCWVVTDQNGEPYRALEWGNALVRAISHCRALDQPLVWYPAISVGETYAASGAVAIVLALHAWMRRYAPARHAVMLHSSDGPQRAAIVLSQPG